MSNSTYSHRLQQEPNYWNITIERATGRAFDWLCPFCGIDISEGNYVLAHISPVGTGVGLIPGNVVLACQSCNLEMSNQHAWVWCQSKGISFWHMVPILETIRKIFFEITSADLVKTRQKRRYPRVVYSSEKSPRNLISRFLDKHPELVLQAGVDIRYEDLADAISSECGVNISVATTWRMVKKYRHSQERP